MSRSKDPAPVKYSMVAALASVLWTIGVLPARADDRSEIDFGRDIRGILSDTCYRCHGPDEAPREGDLRLDTPDGAFSDLGGYSALVPGDLEKSELFLRITSKDDDERMPPADSGLQLTPAQIDLVRRWILQGAKWQTHWSFVPPLRPRMPDLRDESNRAWRRNPIDDFIAARLELEGLEPSPQADRAALIRRVTLDITGLPPTPAEVDAFLADSLPGAYETVVDRLLSSPRYGERLAVEWLDASRYADTSGYQTDGERSMWRWREWVIDAFNRNLPFDRFTIEQLAGDLLPDPTLDNLIATGFNRNHRANSEGGIVDEEFLVEYAVDRVDTTATVWLGLTMKCARCHEHKYDPITQKEFYEVFAFFDNIPERGRVFKEGNSRPMVEAPTPEMRRQRQDIDRQLRAAEEDFQSVQKELSTAQAAWEASLTAPTGGADGGGSSPTAPTSPIDWTVTRGLKVYYPLDGDLTNDAAADDTAAGGDEERRPEFEGGEAAYGQGILGRAAVFDGKRSIYMGGTLPFEGTDTISLGAWVYPADTGGGTILSTTTDDDLSGLSLDLTASHGDGSRDGNRLLFSLGPRFLDDAFRVETLRSLSPGRWNHVLVTHDGSQRTTGLKVYIDGEVQKVEDLLDTFTGTYEKVLPLRIGRQGIANHFRGAVDEVRYYDRVLSPAEARIIACADSITEAVATPRSERTPGQQEKIRDYFVTQAAPARIRESYRHLQDVWQRKKDFAKTIPTTMVMMERVPRDTFMLTRGEYDKPGEKVSPGVPAVLSALPKGAPRNRLGLAQWLVDGNNPLTARVTMNRFLQMYFGTGLVRTTEDFGAQGEPPTHPELLDWLASEFVHSGWNIKAILRLLVTSATYRQSSTVPAGLLQKDPDNRLLARAPRLRLSAESIRDQALAAGGLLVEKVGGPSVKPYQPAGIWEELSPWKYEPDPGEGLYRRSVYTFWKRTIPPPSMMTFDASARETCVVRRGRTNTPLQALALMNEVTYVEAARAMAERMIRRGGSDPVDRLTLGFRLLLARHPRPQETAVLVAGLRRSLERYRNDEEAAVRLTSVGRSKPSAGIDRRELAAYTAMASLILNLDETITKE